MIEPASSAATAPDTRALPRVAALLPPATPEEEQVITDILFRERTVDVNPWVEYSSRAAQTLLPLVLFYRFVDWTWLLAWEILWFIAMGWRVGMAWIYRRRYPYPRRPTDARRWTLHRHGYQAMGWLSVGLLSLFCFVPGSTAWEMVAAAGICIVYTIAPFYCAERSEMPVSGIAVSVPLAIALLYQQTALHYALASLTLGMIAMLTLWGAQQVGARRNEVRLRLALLEQMNRAEQANAAKSRFLAAASHDLRQPLHALTLFVEALKHRSGADDGRRLVVNIEDSVHALDGLFNALLDISRLDAGTVIPKREDFSIEPLLSRLDAEFGVQARANGLEWICTIADFGVHTDPVLLETILRNLLSNALRYTPRGSIRLVVRRMATHVEIDVMDTGIGIAPEHQHDIFREFHQLDNTERDRSKGLGLGLAIVDRLTRLLDVKLALQSQPGEGSTFTVSVAAGTPTVRHAGESSHMTTLADPLAGMRVLVIDDEREVREGMAALLGGWHCRAILAESGAEAIERLRDPAMRPDLIISDFRLRGGHTGAAAIHAVRAAIGHDMPALIVTGDTAPERLQEADAAGFLLLHKPVKPQKLRTAMQFLLRTRSGSATNSTNHEQYQSRTVPITKAPLPGPLL
jgi:signal transduction histidine kinase/DNA-binding NarL/FixJ family response regulator